MNLSKILKDEGGWFIPLLVGAWLAGSNNSSSSLSESDDETPTMPAKIIKAHSEYVWDFDFSNPKMFLHSNYPVDIWTSPKGQKPTSKNAAHGWTNITTLHRTCLAWWKEGTRLTIENNGDVDVVVSIGMWGD